MCKIQYVGKSEKSFNIRLNNHSKDIKKPNAIEACKHFNNNEHTFSKYGKFIIIEQLQNMPYLEKIWRGFNLSQGNNEIVGREFFPSTFWNLDFIHSSHSLFEPHSPKQTLRPM